MVMSDWWGTVSFLLWVMGGAGADDGDSILPRRRPRPGWISRCQASFAGVLWTWFLGRD